MSNDVMSNASVHKGEGTYVVAPTHVVSFDSRTADGALPVVRIGKHTSVAQNCTFVMSHHDMSRPTTSPTPANRRLWQHRAGNRSSFSRGDIRVGNDVWVGANATIMDGLCIGNGAVVAAGSVVTRDVPPYAVVGGNPARFLKWRFHPDAIRRFEAVRWWDLPPSAMVDVDPWSANVDAFLDAAEAARLDVDV